MQVAFALMGKTFVTTIWTVCGASKAGLGSGGFGLAFSGTIRRQYPPVPDASQECWSSCQGTPESPWLYRKLLISMIPFIDDEQNTFDHRNNWFPSDLDDKILKSPILDEATSTTNRAPTCYEAVAAGLVRCPLYQDHPQCQSDYCPQRWRGYWTWNQNLAVSTLSNCITINLFSNRKAVLIGQLFLSIKILITVFKNIIDSRVLEWDGTIVRNRKEPHRCNG